MKEYNTEVSTTVKDYRNLTQDYINKLSSKTSEVRSVSKSLEMKSDRSGKGAASGNSLLHKYLEIVNAK